MWWAGRSPPDARLASVSDAERLRAEHGQTARHGRERRADLTRAVLSRDGDDAEHREDELRDEIHTTLVHEIAHFYGIDDIQLHEMGWA